MLSYPKAAKEILRAEFGEKAALIEKPNNILAAEYLNAIKAQGCGIKSVFIRREKGFSSSLEIRKILYADTEAGLALLPEATRCSLCKDVIWDGAKLDTALLAAIRLSEGGGDYYGTDAGVIKKIYSASLVSSSTKELCEKSVSPGLTAARVRRTLLCILMGVGREYGLSRGSGFAKPSYALVLAADARGRAYLSQNKKSFTLPVITKPADYAFSGGAVKRGFEFSLRADRVFSLASGESGKYNPLKMTPYMK